MPRKETAFIKRLVDFVRKYSNRKDQNSRRKIRSSLQYLGVIVVSSGSVIYVSKKYAKTTTLLASEEQRRKKLVLLGTGWAAVNFLRYTLASVETEVTDRTNRQ